MASPAHTLLLDPGVFDCHAVLNDFYEAHVRLGNARRAILAGHRDANLARLSVGLEALGPIEGADGADFDEDLAQGGYTMHTLNQHPDNDYDIDTGVIFLRENIPNHPGAARARVAEALRKGGGNFKRAPAARTNAVTVWYAEGHHVDLAIYRRTGTGLEHASGDTWNRCDPEAVPAWFQRTNRSKSPQTRVDQFRRIVRWLKAFAKSRKGWNMPGGIIISALAAEAYRAHPSRDDVSLLHTLEALRDRLQVSTYVAHPVSGTLTGKVKYVERVEFLRDKLDWLLTKLACLRDSDCTEDDARRAWRWMFSHAFWETPSTKKRSVALVASVGIPEVITLETGIANYQNGPTTTYRDGSVLPKGRWLRFDAKGVRASYGEQIHWIVENVGQEAEDEDALGHSSCGTATQNWESTAYLGTHRLICEVRRGNVVLARGVRRVTIG
jgi:hypothetical protein